MLPALVTAAFAWEHRRVARVAALALAFAVPVAGYATWYHSLYGRFSITSYGERFLYARVAPFADCTRFHVPPREWTLCPTQPVGQRPTIEHFMWSRRSPAFRVPPPRAPVLGSFARRVISHQPLDYIAAVAPDVVRGHVDRDLAKVVIDLQRFVYVPGPVLAACLVLALAAALGLGRARRSGLRGAAFLFAMLAVTLVVTSVATAQFSWRYWFPVLVVLPPAGALGWTALTGRGAR